MADHLIKDLEPGLWQRVKIVCARKGVTIREYIKTAIREAVTRDELD